MGDASRIEQDGWTLEVTRSWASAGLEPVAEADAREAGTPLVDVLPQDPDHDGRLHTAVTAPGETQPSLLVSLGYMAAGGFGADALMVPETARVFVVGGTRVICYERTGGRWGRQWEHEVEGGAWGLARHGDMVLASAELELAAWTLEGEWRWAVAVEPPWGYTVDGDTIALDVMGRMTTLDLRTGGAAEAGRMLGRWLRPLAIAATVGGAVVVVGLLLAVYAVLRDPPHLYGDPQIVLWVDNQSPEAVVVLFAETQDGYSAAVCAAPGTSGMAAGPLGYTSWVGRVRALDAAKRVILEQDVSLGEGFHGVLVDGQGAATFVQDGSPAGDGELNQLDPSTACPPAP